MLKREIATTKSRKANRDSGPSHEAPNVMKTESAPCEDDYASNSTTGKSDTSPVVGGKIVRETPVNVSSCLHFRYSSMLDQGRFAEEEGA